MTRETDRASGAALPDFVAVVVAAGRGERFGTSGLPKQFQDLGGRSVLGRAVECIVARPGVRGAVVVLAAEELEGPRGAAARALPGVVDVIAGGASRAESVRRGLAAIGEVPYVLVHDAARPLASATVVDSVIAATRLHGAAVPLLPLHDTVKRHEAGFVIATEDRARLGRAQTPQGARVDWIVPAVDRALALGLEPTDEAAALEHAGHRVAAVAGDPDNVKITTPADLEQARRRWDGASSFLRVGTGFDVHRRLSTSAPHKPLVLGGVIFPDEPGLEGHSDADVVLHAAMDALLGAAGLEDIGTHFPPSDDRWKGADSRDLARRVAALVRGRGYAIVNVDLTVLAESPRIGPRVLEMRKEIAGCLGVDPGQVGVKATTLEGLGAIGRGEGLACQASALLTREGASRPA